MILQRESMDMNQEAQDYLRQFSVPKSRVSHSADSSLESMCDTLTMEKYRLKNNKRKSSSSNHRLPNDWDKVSPDIDTGMLTYDPHLQDITDDLLNNDQHMIQDDEQDTYMNEEAFLEQLLQEDTKPQKAAHRQKHDSKHRKYPKQNKQLYKQHPRKQVMTGHQGNSSISMNSSTHQHHSMLKPLVAGQLVSNESKQAILRRGFCQDEDEPVSISPRHQHQTHHYSAMPKHQNLKKSGDVINAIDSVDSTSYTFNSPPSPSVPPLSIQPGVSLMQPICQKCGWTMTSSTGEVIELSNHQVIEIMESGSGGSGSSPRSAAGRKQTGSLIHHQKDTTSSYTDEEFHQKLAVSTTSAKNSPRQVLQHHHSPRSRKVSQESTHSSPRGGTSHNLSPAAHHNTAISNNGINIIRSPLTTSVHCHSRASQTDPNLLNQDLSPLAEVDGYNSVSNRNAGSGSSNLRQRAFVNAKPPSGRLVRADMLGNNTDLGSEHIPVVDAIKNGNIQLLQDLMTSQPEQAKFHDVQGNNLLHMASERGHLACVQLLSNIHPHYCEQENKAKFTPAALTVKAGHVEVLDWLLENTCARGEILPVQSKKSLLHHAAKFGQDGCLRTVLEKMTAMDRNNSCCDNNGNSPAHVAAKHGHLLCLQSLVEYGVDVTKANKYGHSPCYYADFSNHKLCAGYLMVVETCLNLAKKLIRLERSMEQLSNSLAKYSDNTGGEMTLTYDYNGDRSSATSSVEDDGTRDEAWQLLCRKFEEASKRLVVFRTQNRAVRPLRPTKLALLALAQTKEETQAALSVINKVKTTASTNDLTSDINDASANIQDNNYRSKSVPDLPSSVRKEQDDAANHTLESFHKVVDNAESSFVVTGIPGTRTKPNFNLKNDEFNSQHIKLHQTQITAEIHHSIATDSDVVLEENKSATLKAKSTTPPKPPRKEHKRSSSLGDLIDSNVILTQRTSDDIEYHLQTRVLPPSPLVTHQHHFSDKLIQCEPSPGSLPTTSPPPLPPRQATSKRTVSRRGAEVPPPPVGCGEKEQTSDFFEEVNNGKYDSDTSELDPETLQKILDMQEEIMRCDPSYMHSRGSQIRTPVKLELTSEDFNETYARAAQPDDEDFLKQPIRLKRGPPPIRMRLGDFMNKSGNNSHTDGFEEIDYHLQEQSEEMDEVTENTEEKPWYEMSEEEVEKADNAEAEEFFTLL